MNTIKPHLSARASAIAAAGLLISGTAVYGQTVYSQATTGTYAPSANVIEKTADGSAIAHGDFPAAIQTAWDNNQGGVFNFPSAFVNGTTVLRGTFGAGNTKQLDITSSRAMQSVAANGSFVPVSDAIGIAQNSDTPGFTLTFGPLTDVGTGEAIINEAVTQVGFTVLSRSHATYPADVQARVTYGDGSQGTLTASVGNVKSEDDTFYSFTAPAGKAITSLELSSLFAGTQDPIDTRIAIDDLAFVVSQAALPPSISSISPIPYAIHDPEAPISFTVAASSPIATGDISLELNGSNASGDLEFSGTESERVVTYTGELLPNTTYTMVMTASNDAGTTTTTQTFYTLTEALTLYNSEGFASEELYPTFNPLMPVTHGLATWAPHASEPSTVVVDEDPYGKVLEKINSGASLADWLSFPPVSSGTLIVELDAWVSTTTERTIDLSLSPIGSANMASFVAWGGVEGMLAWYDNAAWQPLVELQPGWHHYEIINYLSGPAAGFYDVLVDDVVVGDKLPWRNASPGSPIDRLRFHSQNTNPIAEYGRIDNLTITAAPEDSNAFPPPTIANFNPVSGSVIRGGEGLQFEVTSPIAVSESGITVSLNGEDISDDLVISGTPTQRLISLAQLPNGRHSIEIRASNAAGESVVVQNFFVADEPLVVFDSDGFQDDTLYPLGPLQPVEDDGSLWIPSAEPAEIVDVGGEQGKALRRVQTGVDRIEALQFQPVSSGILTIEFDARVSVIDTRTLDVSLLHQAGGNMASLIGWGTVADQFAYYDGSAWVSAFQPGTEWHHFTLVHYLSGPKAATYDLEVDGETLAEGLPFRHNFPPGTAVGRLQIGAIRGTVGEYGDVDNLVLTVEALEEVQAGVELADPSVQGNAFTFSFESQAGASHIVEYKNFLDDALWTTLEMVEGDGTAKTVSDESATSNQRFYRVRTE